MPASSRAFRREQRVRSLSLFNWPQAARMSLPRDWRIGAD
jgi:hypothetical protein